MAIATACSIGSFIIRASWKDEFPTLCWRKCTREPERYPTQTRLCGGHSVSRFKSAHSDPVAGIIQAIRPVANPLPTSRSLQLVGEGTGLGGWKYAVPDQAVVGLPMHFALFPGDPASHSMPPGRVKQGSSSAVGVLLLRPMRKPRRTDRRENGRTRCQSPCQDR